MEHNEHVKHGTEVALVKKKKAVANKATIAGIIIALALGGYVYFNGSPFPQTQAVIPEGMPEALREVTSNDAVAKVNGEKIDRTTYNNMLASVGQMAEQRGVDFTNADVVKELKQTALTNVINNILLQQAAKEAKIAGLDEDVEAQIQSVITQLGGEEAYKEALASFNLKESKYRKNIKGQLALNKYIETTLNLSGIIVTEDEISARYNEITKAAGENASTIPKLDDAIKEEIRQILISEKQGALVSEHIETLRAAANIKEFLTF